MKIVNKKLKVILLLKVVVLFTIPTFATIYEDAEDNATTGWRISGDTTNATIKNVFDIERGSQVIKLTGNGKKTSYRIGNQNGRASYIGAWLNGAEKVLKWSMKYDEPFRIYVPITTEHGNRYLTYTNQSVDAKGKIRGGKVNHGLGTDSTDGTWHTFTRDLEADWNEFMPNNHFVSVNGFFIKGSGYIDDVMSLDDSKTLIANAGVDKTITFGESITLDANKSSDLNGAIVSYSWVDSEGNHIGDEATLALDSLSVGTHIFTVTVTDDAENTATDSVTIVVKETICPKITKISSYDTNNTTLDMILSKDGKKAYVVGETALTILDLSNQTNPKLLSSYNISAKSVTLSNDEKIAYVLVDGALKIFDVNDSRHLEILSSYNTSAKNVIISNESKVAYLPNDGFLDINDSIHPKLLDSEIYNSSHNKTINGTKLYLFDESNRGIKIFDISDASHPKYIDILEFYDTEKYYDDMDITFSNDGKRAYMSATQEAENWWDEYSSYKGHYKSIIDLSHDTPNTIFETLGNIPIEKGLSNDYQTIYMTDESRDLKIYDRSNNILGTYYTDTDYILNVTLSKNDKIAYMIDTIGLKILDVSDKANPKLLSSYSDIDSKIKKITLLTDEKTAYIIYENGNLVLLDISDFKNNSNFNPNCFETPNYPNHPILLSSYSLGKLYMGDRHSYREQRISDVILSQDRNKIYIIKDIYEEFGGGDSKWYSVLDVIDLNDSIHPKLENSYYDNSDDSVCRIDDCEDEISPIINSVVANGGTREDYSDTLSNNITYKVYSPEDEYDFPKDSRILIFGLPSH